MKNLNRLKAWLIRNIADRFNDTTYPYLPPQLPTQEMIDKMPLLEELEKQVYTDISNRIDPDGLYHYKWYEAWMAEDIYIPDIGDMYLHQGIIIGALAMRLKITNNITTMTDFILLLDGAEKLIENGYLIRGKYRYRKENGKWLEGGWKYANKVSGDQLGGFTYGLSLAYCLHPNLFGETLKEKILSFTDRMIANKMMLQERDGSTVSGSTDPKYPDNWLIRWWSSEMPYDSWRIIEGHATTKLALLSLAYRLSGEGKYYEFYNKLINKYAYNSLAEYSSFMFGNKNNFFGTHINAISLFAIGLNMGFPEYVKRGLKRIAWQTRDYGFSIFDLFSKASEDTALYGFEDEIKKRLYSYFIPCGEDKIKRSIFFFGKKERVSALSIRARNRLDIMYSRRPFDDRNNFNPDLWTMNNIGMDDFMTEYWLAKYLRWLYNYD